MQKASLWSKAQMMMMKIHFNGISIYYGHFCQNGWYFVEKLKLTEKDFSFLILKKKNNNNNRILKSWRQHTE